MTLLQILLVVATIYDYHIQQMDVITTFLMVYYVKKFTSLNLVDTLNPELNIKFFYY